MKETFPEDKHKRSLPPPKEQPAGVEQILLSYGQGSAWYNVSEVDRSNFDDDVWDNAQRRTFKSLPGEGVEQAAEAYAERIHLADIDWNSEQEKQKYIKSHDKSFQELYELTKHNFIAGASWDGRLLFPGIP